METIKTDLRDMKVRIVCDCPEDKEAKCVIASVGSKTEEFAGGVRRRVTITAENFAACTINLRVRAAVMYDGRAFGDDDAFFAAGYQISPGPPRANTPARTDRRGSGCP